MGCVCRGREKVKADCKLPQAGCAVRLGLPSALLAVGQISALGLQLNIRLQLSVPRFFFP